MITRNIAFQKLDYGASREELEINQWAHRASRSEPIQLEPKILRLMTLTYFYTSLGSLPIHYCLFWHDGQTLGIKSESLARYHSIRAHWPFLMHGIYLRRGCEWMSNFIIEGVLSLRWTLNKIIKDNITFKRWRWVQFVNTSSHTNLKVQGCLWTCLKFIVYDATCLMILLMPKIRNIKYHHNVSHTYHVTDGPISAVIHWQEYNMTHK